MKFFKKMSEKESVFWRRGAVLGFYVYLLITAINYFYYLAAGEALIAPDFTF